jgi:hypothetical protein
MENLSQQTRTINRNFRTGEQSLPMGCWNKDQLSKTITGSISSPTYSVGIDNFRSGENGCYNIEAIVSNRFYTVKRHYSHYHARYRSVNKSGNLNNLIPVQQTPIQFTNKPGLKLLQLAVLNARSIKNKTLQIKDYIVDNDTDIMAVTETWLKGHENCEFATRDICPQKLKNLRLQNHLNHLS